MSIYYGYKCLDCNKGSDHWFNHAINQLRIIYANREHFIRVYALSNTVNWIYQIGISNDPGICEWLYDHRECSNMLIEDEYGEVYSIDEVKELTIYDKIGISKEICDKSAILVIEYFEQLEKRVSVFDKILYAHGNKIIELEKK